MTVVMYVKPGCPYCQAAREHLAGEGEDVEERDATENRVESCRRSCGAETKASKSASLRAAAERCTERPVGR